MYLSVLPCYGGIPTGGDDIIPRLSDLISPPVSLFLQHSDMLPLLLLISRIFLIQQYNIWAGRNNPDDMLD